MTSIGTVSEWILPSQHYGASELKAIYQKFFWRGLIASIATYAFAFGAYYLMQILEESEPPQMTRRIIQITEIGPPPSISNANKPPAVALEAPVAKQTEGIPIPVPDVAADPDNTLPTQADMRHGLDPLGDRTGTEGPDVQPGKIEIEGDGPPPEWRSVEEQPSIVRKVEPKYPDLAIRAGLEGKVWVKIWVDKEGKVRQVLVQKSDSEIFNEAALDAAKQFLFTPAYMNNGPVSVWVSVPFKFKLADRK